MKTIIIIGFSLLLISCSKEEMPFEPLQITNPFSSTEIVAVHRNYGDFIISWTGVHPGTASYEIYVTGGALENKWQYITTVSATTRAYAWNTAGSNIPEPDEDYKLLFVSNGKVIATSAIFYITPGAQKWTTGINPGDSLVVYTPNGGRRYRIQEPLSVSFKTTNKNLNYSLRIADSLSRIVGFPNSIEIPLTAEDNLVKINHLSLKPGKYKIQVQGKDPRSGIVVLADTSDSWFKLQ